jgi:hypothetical protein
MPDSSTSRAYTQDEVRDKFLTHVAHLVEFWSNLQNGMPYRTRLEGLAHSILASLDGSAAALPGFVVAPAPHPTDCTYCMEQGENWYPEAPAVECDIAGHLHELIFEHIRRVRSN